MSHKDKNQQNNTLANITTYQAGVAQAAVHRRLQKLSDSILEPYDITKTQWLIIGTVLDAGKRGARISELAEAVGTTLPYLTNTINILESKKIVLRRTDDEDSRSKYITVHPNFISKTEHIESALRDGLRNTIYRHIAPDDFRTYMKVVFKLQSIDEL